MTEKQIKENIESIQKVLKSFPIVEPFVTDAFLHHETQHLLQEVLRRLHALIPMDALKEFDQTLYEASDSVYPSYEVELPYHELLEDPKEYWAWIYKNMLRNGVLIKQYVAELRLDAEDIREGLTVKEALIEKAMAWIEKEGKD